MNPLAALYVRSGRLVTGACHGDAFGKLTEEERDDELHSGFYDPATGKFYNEEQAFYVKTIIMIRHAACNDDSKDPPLNTRGTAQAEKIAFGLAHIDLSEFICYTSPYQRCIQTAEIISRRTATAFTVNEDIRDCEEGIEPFRARTAHVLESLPRQSILVTHCDFIQTLIHLAVFLTGEVSVPVGSVTVVCGRKLLCAGQEECEGVLL